MAQIESALNSLKAELCFSILQLQNRHAELSRNVIEVSEKITILEKSTILDTVKSELCNLKSELDRCINKWNDLSTEVAKFRQKELPEKKCSRDHDVNNIIIHGLTLRNNDVKSEVSKFLYENLGIKPAINDAWIPETRKKLTYTPVIIQCHSPKDKKLIFANCHRLKTLPTPISIWDDLPSVQRKARKKAVEEVKQARTQGQTWKVFRSEIIKKKQKELKETPTEPVHKKHGSPTKNVRTNHKDHRVTPVFGINRSANANPGTSNVRRNAPNLQPEVKDEAIKDQIAKFKEDYFLRYATYNISFKRVAPLNSGGNAGNGLIARLARKRIDMRPRCSCTKETKIEDFHDYIRTKKLDMTLADNLVKHVDKTRKLLKQRFSDICKLKKECYCQYFCVEELLLNADFVKLCEKTVIEIRGEPTKPREEECNMLGLLF